MYVHFVYIGGTQAYRRRKGVHNQIRSRTTVLDIISWYC